MLEQYETMADEGKINWKLMAVIDKNADKIDRESVKYEVCIPSKVADLKVDYILPFLWTAWTECFVSA